MKTILIRGGRIIDPSQGIDRIADLLLSKGVVKGLADHIDPPDGAAVIDATGMVVSPGFIDLHCHLREPGFEYKETIATGTLAAARGGFTTVCAMPNTSPTMDTRATVDFVMRMAREEGAVRVLPIGCITKGSKGKELAEMGELAEAGAIGFSDDGHPVADSNVMRQALSYSSVYGLPIIDHCEAPDLFRDGVMNEGWVSNHLGLRGVPNSAEDVMVARDIALAELTGGRLHLAHVSTAGAVQAVRDAKERGLNVTCEVTPHHLTLTDRAVLGRFGDGVPGEFDPLTPVAYDTNAKVNPPLRGQKDVDAMVQALADGVVDVIATDHAPHSTVEKLCTFDEADFGISGLETALGSVMSLVHSGKITLPALVERLTIAPARFLLASSASIDHRLGTLKEGAPADVTVFDPDAEWRVDPTEFASKGKNTPLAGATLRGRVVATVVGGEVRHNQEDSALGQAVRKGRRV
ncbi:MAG: dihydroorotase [Chloroflexi bacterium]|nr:dihydroorotase [Chloroflexota bacterium]